MLFIYLFFHLRQRKSALLWVKLEYNNVNSSRNINSLNNKESRAIETLFMNSRNDPDLFNINKIK